MIPHERVVARGHFSIDLYRAKSKREAHLSDMIICTSSGGPRNTPRPIVIINYRADKSIARVSARDTSDAGSIRAGR